MKKHTIISLLALFMIFLSPTMALAYSGEEDTRVQKDVVIIDYPVDDYAEHTLINDTEKDVVITTMVTFNFRKKSDLKIEILKSGDIQKLLFYGPLLFPLPITDTWAKKYWINGIQINPSNFTDPDKTLLISSILKLK